MFVTKVGFVGLGIMGMPMARNLMKAGYPLTVYNRTRSKAEQLGKEGAQVAESPAELGRASEVVVTIVSDSPDVEEVVLGPNGVAEGISSGGLVIDMSTISPAVSRKVATALKEKGADFLDAPVSGGPEGAEGATLSIMVGGPQEAFDRAKPILEAMGKTIVRIGDNGAGSMTKLCNQVACVVNLWGTCEVMVLAKKAGLDVRKVLGALAGGSAWSRMMEKFSPAILERDFAPGFFVRLQQKDLRLVLEAANELKVPLPALSLVNQMFRVLEAQGQGESGTGALVQVLEGMAGVEVS